MAEPISPELSDLTTTPLPTPSAAPLPPDQLARLLKGLSSPEAKRRESTLHEIAAKKVDELEILRRVRELARADPQEYVRVAAANVFQQLGYSVPPAYVPRPQTEIDFSLIFLFLLLSLLLALLTWWFLILSAGSGCNVNCNVDRLSGIFIQIPLATLILFATGSFVVGTVFFRREVKK